ncbi:hypothetical protein BGX21_008754, partial [Mortierella sp. AD011]
ATAVPTTAPTRTRPGPTTAAITNAKYPSGPPINRVYIQYYLHHHLCLIGEKQHSWRGNWLRY